MARKKRKTKSLNLTVTQTTHDQIKFLSDRADISMSDLVAQLANARFKRLSADDKRAFEREYGRTSLSDTSESDENKETS